MNKVLILASIIIYSILFSGCSRVINWGQLIFNQGCKPGPCPLDIAREYIRTIRVYDQFNTLGIFHALLISPDVIKAYADIRSNKFGLCPEESQALYDNEYEIKAQNVISFYALVYEDHRPKSPLFIPGRFENATWDVHLEVDGVAFEPNKVKIINLRPEYKLILERYLNNFQKHYIIQFMATDCDGNCLITPNTKEIKLVFTSLINKVCLSWVL